MLEFRAIKDHGDFRLDVSLMCADGMVTALYGRSGSGKTSIINMIAGLQNPDVGRIAVGDRLLYDSYQNINIPAHKRNAGYIFQDGRLFPHMSVISNLRYGMKDKHDKNLFDETVELLGIEDLLERRPHKLSGGEKQRVAIGRALLSKPDFLLMDEPLSALDASRKAELIPFISRMVERFRMPVIYVTHNIDELLALCDNVVLLKNGSLLDVGAVENVVSNPQNMAELSLTGRITVLKARSKPMTGSSGIIRLTDGKLQIPSARFPENTKLRVTIKSEDVTLSVKKPEGLSARNIMHGLVTGTQETDDGGVSIKIDIGVNIYATITKEAAEELGIKEGVSVYIILKTIALSRRSTKTVR